MKDNHTAKNSSSNKSLCSSSNYKKSIGNSNFAFDINSEKSKKEMTFSK